MINDNVNDDTQRMHCTGVRLSGRNFHSKAYQIATRTHARTHTHTHTHTHTYTQHSYLAIW